MKSLTTGAISGCLTWVILFVVSIPCIWPLFFIALSVATHADFSYQLTQPILCPAGSTLKVSTFKTTTTDSSHHSIGATGYDMNCVSANGEMLKKDVIVEYLLLWRGLGIAGGVVLSILFAFLLAAPAGVLVGRFFGRKKATAA